MKITHIHIERFRGFQNEDFEVGSLLTAIAGQNGTQKSTLLGIITQTFTLKTEDSMRVEKPLCGGSYISACAMFGGFQYYQSQQLLSEVKRTEVIRYILSSDPTNKAMIEKIDTVFREKGVDAIYNQVK